MQRAILILFHIIPLSSTFYDEEAAATRGRVRRAVNCFTRRRAPGPVGHLELFRILWIQKVIRIR